MELDVSDILGMKMHIFPSEQDEKPLQANANIASVLNPMEGSREGPDSQDVCYDCEGW